MGKRTLLAATALAAFATMQCSGGGSSGGSSSEAIQLSVTDVTPFQFLVIRHTSIAAGSTVSVTFDGGAGYRVTAQTALTEAGAAKIPTPPFFDRRLATTAAFTTGDVKVSVAGIASEKPLHIQAVPSYALGVPGSTLRAILGAQVTSLQSSRQKASSLATDGGLGTPAALARIDQSLARLKQADEELAAYQRFTVVRGGSSYVLRGDELALAERIALAELAGLGGALAASGVPATSAMLQRAVVDLDPVAILTYVRDRAIPGMQAMTAYLSVAAGVGGSLFGPEVGAAMSIAITGVGAVGGAAVAFVDELLLDAAKGNDPDYYKAGNHALEIAHAGLISAALAWAGGVEAISDMWGLGFDLKDEIEGLRQLLCQKYDRGGASLRQTLPLALAAAAATQPFCDGTRGCCGYVDGGTGASDPCGVAGDWTMTCPNEVCASGGGGYPAATGAFSINPAVAAAGGATTPSVGFVGFIGVFDVARCSLRLDMANLGSLVPADNPCPLPPASVIALRDGTGSGRIPFQEWGGTECRCSELLPLPCTFARR